MDYANKIFSKKNIIIYLILAIIILTIPFVVSLVQKQTQLKSFAANADFKFVPESDGSVKCDGQGENCSTTKTGIQIRITSPF